MKVDYMTPKEEYINLMYETEILEGLDEISSKNVAILYIEPNEISLEELAKRTGYSLSAVSTSMKFIERMGFIKRIKKPKSKKMYFYMEKDMINTFTELFIKRYQKIFSISKDKIPEIIKKYELEKSKNSKEELKIIKNYYKQMLFFEKIMEKLSKIIENAQRG